MALSSVNIANDRLDSEMFRTAFDYRVSSFLSLSDLLWGCQGHLFPPQRRGIEGFQPSLELAHPFSIVCAKGAVFLSLHRISCVLQLLKLNNFKISHQTALLWN